MCGVLGIITRSGSTPSVDDAGVTRMRDTMTRRGPDDAGLWRFKQAVLAHRRLSVVDTSVAGHQPMVTRDGRFALVYNGELYNDAELRRDLEARGVRFRSTSDTETILELLALDGVRGLDRLRGMYALGLWDTQKGTLVLARDPLGIKPLYYAIARTQQGAELVFASEIPAILAHPSITPRPDPVVVAGYLTTIRTTIGERTLFDGVKCVRPGEVLELATSPELSIRTVREAGWLPATSAANADVHDLVETSVKLHLRSDVPICCLLSGGLDSSIVAGVATREVGSLQTFCSGAVSEGEQAAGEDFAFARMIALALGTQHTEAPVTREMFIERWPAMVRALGVPLSTPNEVAINEVARTLRAAGKIVTLSGEGADELFAGYQLPMELAAAHEASMTPDVRRDAAARARSRAGFQISSNAWVNPAGAAELLNPAVLASVEGYAYLNQTYEEIAQRCEEESPEDPVQVHLSFHRRVNLVGLLQRLDTATMLESVEGRTPFADADLAAASIKLSMNRKFVNGRGTAGTKIALREAFARELPAQVVTRAKASFPLPFQRWMGPVASTIGGSAFAREFFTPRAIEAVAANSEQLWPVAWPMTNLALWGQVWWG